MALPHRGDPRRYILLAGRSMLGMGIFLIVIGLLSLVPAVMFAFRLGTRNLPLILLQSAISFLVYSVPGIGCVLLRTYIRRHQMWAVITALVISSLIALFLLIACSVSVAVTLSSGLPPLAIWIMVGVMVLMLLAVLQTVYFLARSFPAMKLPVYGTIERGFEPVMLPIDEVIS